MSTGKTGPTEGQRGSRRHLSATLFATAVMAPLITWWDWHRVPQARALGLRGLLILFAMAVGACLALSFGNASARRQQTNRARAVVSGVSYGVGFFLLFASNDAWLWDGPHWVGLVMLPFLIAYGIAVAPGLVPLDRDMAGEPEVPKWRVRVPSGWRRARTTTSDQARHA